MQVTSVKYILGAVLLLALPAAIVEAGDVDASFRKAYEQLNAGNYPKANQLFAELVASHPDHMNAATHLFFKAKSEYYAARLEQANRDLERFLERYPNSEYAAYAYLFLGNSYYRLSRPEQAAVNYANSYRFSRDKKLDQLLLKAVETAVANSPSKIVEKLRAIPFAEDRTCPFVISAARGLLGRGHRQAARSLLSSCPEADIDRLTSPAGHSPGQQVQVGVVLPLSGELQKYGEQLLEGINLKAEQYGRETGIRLTPAVYDSKGENLEAARVVKRLTDEGFTAAIGPLTSEATAVASAVLACSDMPLIAPAASEGGLTELSESCFQLQPNLDWQGIRMADLAVQWLKADTAAIITPSTPENLRMARAFGERFEELGGTVLAVEYFRSRETDFGPYIRDIKSLAVGELLDSITYVNEDGDTIEAEEVPVWIDCIYIPADAAQLRQLLPQIHFYNLNAAYLGGDGWGSSEVYKLGESITKTCYFSSGVIAEAVGENAQRFVMDFDHKYGRQPGRLEALGYDAMELICRALKSGYRSRAEISRYLSGVQGYSGAAGAVSFGRNRENIELPIYTIEDSGPKQVVFE
ncbi:MAG: penicillin-binding protein activator [Candidatus Zixiibacteriota bacterium]|nr:MAG: penicillin-binding protein activator [candidate division Zixibacteria bacterium]